MAGFCSGAQARALLRRDPLREQHLRGRRLVAQWSSPKFGIPGWVVCQLEKLWRRRYDLLPSSDIDGTRFARALVLDLNDGVCILLERAPHPIRHRVGLALLVAPCGPFHTYHRQQYHQRLRQRLLRPGSNSEDKGPVPASVFRRRKLRGRNAWPERLLHGQCLRHL